MDDDFVIKINKAEGEELEKYKKAGKRFNEAEIRLRKVLDAIKARKDLVTALRNVDQNLFIRDGVLLYGDYETVDTVARSLEKLADRYEKDYLSDNKESKYKYRYKTT
jgi:hypothetical protein